MDFNFETLTNGFRSLGDVIHILKEAKDLLPKNRREPIEKKLEEAERDAKLARAQIAQGLGYELCRCTFPPQIMLSNGEQEQCPKCERTLSNVIYSSSKATEECAPWD